MNELTFTDCQNMAVAIHRSGFMGVKSPDEALTLMMLAQAEGRHPATVQRDYHIIKGKPTLKADTILARFQESGGRVEYVCYSDEKCEMKFTSKNSELITVDWTIERAQRAGVTGNDTWKKYPRAMLRSRCIAEGVRAISPSVFCGMLASEEAEDLPHENGSVAKTSYVQNKIEQKKESTPKKILDVDSEDFNAVVKYVISKQYTVEQVENKRELTERAREILLSELHLSERNETENAEYETV